MMSVFGMGSRPKVKLGKQICELCVFPMNSNFLNFIVKFLQSSTNLIRSSI